MVDGRGERRRGFYRSAGFSNPGHELRRYTHFVNGAWSHVRAFNGHERLTLRISRALRMPFIT